ncbi:MAG: hypothetical protein EZS28_015814 [Streblomastix strix]|uniref:Uncharacterized protein n=1 Tax=Streblomastix strix TaxID=222440 RepID=A0A5J4W1P0_9EUKA|nr:MAG: hypothetical protein EZS28_015814 [Streblomastix strix]
MASGRWQIKRQQRNRLKQISASGTLSALSQRVNPKDVGQKDMWAVKQKSSSVQTNQQNIKHVTIEKGAKRAYNRKTETDNAAKELVDQMTKAQEEKKQETIEIVNGIVSEMVDASLVNETINEQIIEQTIEEKRQKILHDLCNAEGNQEERLVKQQEAYRLEKQWKQEDQEKKDKATPNSLDNIIDRYFIQNRVNIQVKLINERVKGAWVDSENYTKIVQKTGEKKQVTGKLIDLTLVEDGDLCVIDFDINKNLPKEKIDEIRQNIIDNMLPANVGLVKTCHSGLHAYCNKNSYRLSNNRCIKCIVLDNIEIYIFAQMHKHKSFENDPMQTDLMQNRVVGPNTSIRETKNNVRETLKYETIRDWANITHLANLRDILES